MKGSCWERGGGKFFQGGGGGGANFTKNKIKSGLGQFADLRAGWQERGGGVFERGVDTPMHTKKTSKKKTIFCRTLLVAVYLFTNVI